MTVRCLCNLTGVHVLKLPQLDVSCTLEVQVEGDEIALGITPASANTVHFIGELLIKSFFPCNIDVALQTLAELSVGFKAAPSLFFVGYL